LSTVGAASPAGLVSHLATPNAKSRIPSNIIVVEITVIMEV